MKNYHTHTYRCMHASGSDEDYVLAAIEAGYTVLGFADHTPWKYDSNFVSKIRMPLSQFNDYYKSIYELKEKYKDKIEIKIGLECEYYPKYTNWLREFAKENKLDYLIFGNHYHETDELRIYYGTQTIHDSMLDNYVNSTIEGLKTGLYSYIAHPDLFMRARKWDQKCEEATHKICKFCEENEIIMEYNLAGLRYSIVEGEMLYPHDEFWKIASTYKIKAIIGVDAHSPSNLRDTSLYELAYKKLSEWNIEIVENIPYLR